MKQRAHHNHDTTSTTGLWIGSGSGSGAAAAAVAGTLVGASCTWAAMRSLRQGVSLPPLPRGDAAASGREDAAGLGGASPVLMSERTTFLTEAAQKVYEKIAIVQKIRESAQEAYNALQPLRWPREVQTPVLLYRTAFEYLENNNTDLWSSLQLLQLISAECASVASSSLEDVKAYVDRLTALLRHQTELWQKNVDETTSNDSIHRTDGPAINEIFATFHATIDDIKTKMEAFERERQA